MRLISVIILLGVLLTANSLFTFYQFEPQSAAYYKCIKPTANGKIIVLYLYYKDQVVPDFVENLKNALEAGLAVEPLIVPTRCRPIDEELKLLQGWFAGAKFERIWLVLEEVASECSWENYTPEDNCKYLQEYLAKSKALGMNIQIATSQVDWIEAFKSQTGCPEASSNTILWWAPSISETYTQIGGWKSPYMQMVSESSICGQDTVVNKVIEDTVEETVI